jgi:hypothetical protein
MVQDHNLFVGKEEFFSAQPTDRKLIQNNVNLKYQDTSVIAKDYALSQSKCSKTIPCNFISWP